MTNNEAFKILRELYQQCCHTDILFHTDETSARCHAVWMAIQALELKIPKKPMYKAIDMYAKNRFRTVSLCPSCAREIVAGDMHCIRCGQAIDWEEET